MEKQSRNFRTPEATASGSGSRMKMRALRLLRLTAAVSAVALCVGLTAVAGASVTAAEPTLNIGDGVAGACGSQNPINYLYGVPQFVFDQFIQEKANGKLAPMLATSWQVKPGNKVMTLTLRRGVRFSDGQPFDAQAAKTWLDWRALKGGAYDPELGPVRSVRVLGKYRIQLALESPNPEFALMLSSYFATSWGNITSPKAIEKMKADPKSTLLDSRTFGAGPYVYSPSESVTNDHCTYRPNKYYYDKSKIKWGKIVLKNITNANTQLAGMESGQIDVMIMANPETAASARAAGIKVIADLRGGNRRIHFRDLAGKRVPALADVRVRQALNYAIDKPLLARTVCLPGSKPSSLLFALQTVPDDPKYSNYYPYNPAKARALLAAAGYANGFQMKIGTFSNASGVWDFEPLAQAVARDLAAVGVKAEVVSDPNQAWDASAYGGFLGEAGPIPDFQNNNYYLAKNSFIQSGEWYDPGLNRLYLQAIRASGAKATALWRQWNARTVTQAFGIGLCTSAQFTYASKRVGGVTTSVLYGANALTDWYPTGK